MIIYHLIGITLALCIDRVIGDPPSWPHPVRWIGSLITRLERQLNKGSGRKSNGIILVIIIASLSFLITFLLVWGALQFHVIAGILLEAVIIATTIAQHGLAHAANQVYQPLVTGDEHRAREELTMIVGRDTDQLDEKELTRATVETVAENVSEGITVPLFLVFLGGSPLAIVYRAINTCDSMIGYKNERYRDFGWASAKFDDVLNWIPARITGYCMMLGNHAYQQRKTHAIQQLCCEARKHPSPNSGWGEAATAILLGVQLGGINYYHGVISDRTKMGQALQPLRSKHIPAVIKIMKRTVWVFLILLWIGGGIIAITSTWLQP